MGPISAQSDVPANGLVSGGKVSLDASDVKRLKDLEHENGRLKRMYAELALENAALKDVIAKKL